MGTNRKAAEADMRLPEGKTCADCASFKPTCEGLVGAKADWTSCDWAPSRFAQKQLWLIWSHEHGGWWKHQGHGYTTDVGEAGRFDQNAAIMICSNANFYLRPSGPPNEIMTPAPETLRASADYFLTGQPRRSAETRP